jgi:uncharacterized cupin superfamily protein
MGPMAHFNLHRAEPRPDPDNPEPYTALEAGIGNEIGAEHLAGNLIEIPPGVRAWPYHWEGMQEEWLLVLSGTPTLRTPEEETVLAPGDVVAFPVGRRGAHQVWNAGTEPCRIVMLSNRAEVNVTGYPDSGKLGVRTPWVRANFPDAAGVGYWEGE